MIRCAEIEQLMCLINVQAVTINKIAKYRNIDIEADNFLQEVLTFCTSCIYFIIYTILSFG